MVAQQEGAGPPWARDEAGPPMGKGWMSQVAPTWGSRVGLNNAFHILDVCQHLQRQQALSAWEWSGGECMHS